VDNCYHTQCFVIHSTNHSVETDDRYVASGHSTDEMKQNNIFRGSLSFLRVTFQRFDNAIPRSKHGRKFQYLFLPSTNFRAALQTNNRKFFNGL
jgi:hypothetical protein